MKKLFIILGGLLCCMMCELSVRADVIWTPEDSFYQKHQSECAYVNRRFTANGPDGVVILYQSPEMPVETARWKNGERYYIDFIYEDSDGIVWGVYENGSTHGWMPMEYMDVVYDTISFEEEYGDQITTENGNLEKTYHGKEIYTWSYPGAETGGLYELDEQYPDMPGYNQIFVDEYGHRWGKVGYYLGYKNFWICLDQPEADYEQLYPDGGPLRGNGGENSENREVPEADYEQLYSDEASLRGEAEENYENREVKSEKRITPKMNEGMVSTAVSMVILVVLITAVLLVRLKRRKK